jgi:hypothetical protein
MVQHVLMAMLKWRSSNLFFFSFFPLSSPLFLYFSIPSFFVFFSSHSWLGLTVGPFFFHVRLSYLTSYVVELFLFFPSFIFLSFISFPLFFPSSWEKIV